MPDTGFEVRYMKRRQEGQFEPAEAEVKAVFTSESTDFKVVDAYLNACKTSVLRVLRQREAPAASSGGEVITAPASETPEAPKSRRGRPSKEEIAKRMADEALAKSDPLAELSDDGKEEPEQKTDDDLSDMMGGEPEQKKEPKVYTDNELQNEAAKAVQRIGDSKQVRATITQFGKNIPGIPPEKREEFVKALGELKVNKK